MPYLLMASLFVNTLSGLEGVKFNEHCTSTNFFNNQSEVIHFGLLFRDRTDKESHMYVNLYCGLLQSGKLAFCSGNYFQFLGNEPITFGDTNPYNIESLFRVSETDNFIILRSGSVRIIIAKKPSTVYMAFQSSKREWASTCPNSQ